MKKQTIVALRQMLDSEGRLVASKVLHSATPRQSPLHGEFEWDDAKAGHQHRLWQARSLIKQYNVVIKKPEQKLVHVPPPAQSKSREGEYRPLKTVVQIQDDYDRAMSEAKAKLLSAKTAVNLLEDVAKGRGDTDRASIISIALRGLDTADEALRRLH